MRHSEMDTLSHVRVVMAIHRETSQALGTVSRTLTLPVVTAMRRAANLALGTASRTPRVVTAMRRAANLSSGTVNQDKSKNFNHPSHEWQTPSTALRHPSSTTAVFSCVRFLKTVS